MYWVSAMAGTLASRSTDRDAHRLPDQALHHVAVADDVDGPAAGSEQTVARIDAGLVIHRREEILHGNRVAIGFARQWRSMRRRSGRA